MQISILNGRITNINEVISPENNYELPVTVNVNGASSNYDYTTGNLQLTNLTDTITTQATAVSEYFNSTITLTNCNCNKVSDSYLSGSYSATILPDDGYYLSSVTTTLGALVVNDDRRSATIIIENITEDFTITAIGTAIVYSNVELYPNNNGTTDYTKVLLPRAMSDDSKQDKLNTEQLDAVNSGIDSTKVSQIATNTENINTNTNNITSINEKIPVAATSENQLADKNFVNSSIGTNTANFIGTFNNIVDLRNYQGTVTNNDYAFVINKVINNGTPFNSFNAMITYVTPLIEYVVNYDYAFVVNSSDNTKIDVYRYDISKSTITQRWGEPVATAIDINDFQKNPAYNRYKYTTEQNPAEWLFEYTLNNSSFTASQWAAINSGITSQLVSRIGEKELFECTYGTTTFAEITTALSNGKLPVCIYDNKQYIYVGLSTTNRYTFSSQLFDTQRYISVNSSDSWGAGNNNFEITSNKVTSISSSSTDAQYPSAKCVYNELSKKVNVLKVTDITALTNEQCENLQVGDVILDEGFDDSAYIVMNNMSGTHISLFNADEIEGNFFYHYYIKSNNTWSYDGTEHYNPQPYDVSSNDFDGQPVGTVYIFTNNFKDKVVSRAKILAIPGELLNPDDTNVYFYYPNFNPNDNSSYTFTTHEVDGYIYSLTFYIDELDNDKLKLDLSTGFIDFKVQSKLTTSLTTDTLTTAIGFNSNGDLVKGTISGEPTITITLSQVIDQDPLIVQLTNEQYNVFANNKQVIIDLTALGENTTVWTCWYEDSSVLKFSTEEYSTTDGYHLIDISKSTKKASYELIFKYIDPAQIGPGSSSEAGKILRMDSYGWGELTYLKTINNESIFGNGNISVGTTVIANPTLVGTESDLTGLEIDGIKYKISGAGGITNGVAYEIV